jgi:hypothetical protein
MKIGDRVKITEDAKDLLPYDVDTEFTIIRILENADYPYVLNAEEFGKDWMQFFNENEIIKNE